MAGVTVFGRRFRCSAVKFLLQEDTVEQAIRREIATVVDEAAKTGLAVHAYREAFRLARRYPRAHSTDELAGMIIRRCSLVPGVAVDMGLAQILDPEDAGSKPEPHDSGE